MFYESDYLAHYGVKGMKWGVRNWQEKDGTLTNAGQKRYEQMQKERHLSIERAKNSSTPTKTFAGSVKKTRPNKHKPASKMTDDELRAQISRLKLEQEYKKIKDDLSGKGNSNQQGGKNNNQQGGKNNNQQGGKKEPKKTFGEKHPVMKKLFGDTLQDVLAIAIKNRMEEFANKKEAERRLQRAVDMTEREIDINNEFGIFKNQRIGGKGKDDPVRALIRDERKRQDTDYYPGQHEHQDTNEFYARRHRKQGRHGSESSNTSSTSELSDRQKQKADWFTEQFNNDNWYATNSDYRQSKRESKREERRKKNAIRDIWKQEEANGWWSD